MRNREIQDIIEKEVPQIKTQLDNMVNKKYGILENKINKFGNKQKYFFNFRRSLLQNRTVNITFWGDSISTGKDKLGINSSNPSGEEYAPDGITTGEAYTHIISSQISNLFKHKTFNFYNRAIGGEIISSYLVNKTFNGVEKPWIDHIKDTEPDLLFIGFGMNHNNYSKSVDFARCIKEIKDYIYANFNKIPDIVFVTSPTPVYIEGNTTWSSDIQQESRRNTNKIIRYFGADYCDYIIDVGRYSDICRFGTDIESIYFEQNENFETIGVNILKELSDSYTISNKIRDFAIKFTLQTTSKTDGESLLIQFNTDNDGEKTKSNQVAIYPNKGGFTVISSYGRISDSANFPVYKTQEYTHSGTLTTFYCKLEKRNNTVKFTINDLPEQLVVFDNNFDLNNLLGKIIFKKQGGNLSTISIVNLKLFEGKYVQYEKELSEEQMWGKYIDGDYSKKAITGGNGANHPSSLGVRKVYGNAINEFINDLSSSSKIFSEIELELERDDVEFTVNAGSISGFCYGSVNIPLMQGVVTNSDKTIKLRKNPNVTSPGKRTLLTDNEYGIYVTNGVQQIIFKNTMGVTGYATKFLINTYTV